MPTSPTYALAHVFVPNLVKLRGADHFVAAMEKGHKEFLDGVWTQAGLRHDPLIVTLQSPPYRLALLDLPPPREIGEAYLFAVVLDASRRGESDYARIFTLDRDYVLATRSERTLICEQDGARQRKYEAGPPWSGDRRRDANAFAIALLGVLDSNCSRETRLAGQM